MRKVSKPEGEQNEGERVRVNKRNTLSLTVEDSEPQEIPDEISDDESLVRFFLGVTYHVVYKESFYIISENIIN